jgi:hypothetical protein
VALDDAMNALARHDSRKVQVVEMRFFGGVSVQAGNNSIACCSQRWSVRPRSATPFYARRARATSLWNAKSALC